LVYVLPSTAMQHTKSHRVSSLSFHRYDPHNVNDYINQKNGFTRRYNKVYDGILLDSFFYQTAIKCIAILMYCKH